MSYQLVRQLQEEAIPVQHSCRVLSVSRSGYYEAQRRSAKPVLCKASVHLKAAFMASHQSYGSRRLVAAMANQGIQVGRYKVRSLMRKAGLKPVWKRKFIHTTDSKHDLPIAANVLDRQFNPVAPNMAYVADITYIRTGAGWLYLAIVLDLFARKVVGWAMGPGMPAELVCDALSMAIQQRQLRQLGSTTLLQTLATTLRLLAKRWLMLAAELKEIDAALEQLTSQSAPHLRGQIGVGPQTAAVLIAVAGDNPERLHSEAALAALCGVSPLQASSGKTVRHRLNRGGDRSANNALWTIAMVRMRSEPRTRAYVERRTAEGMSNKEIHRCLKRYIVRELYPLILADLAAATNVS